MARKFKNIPSICDYRFFKIPPFFWHL